MVPGAQPQALQHEVLPTHEVLPEDDRDVLGSVATKLPSAREVLRMFPATTGEETVLRAILWSVVSYGFFALYALDWVPAALFIPVVSVTFLRNQNALHESYHAPRLRSWLVSLGRWVSMVLPWPLFLGGEQVARNHAVHHGRPGSPRDPDRYMYYGPWWKALLNALFQPEQSVWFFLQREGMNHRLALQMVVHLAMMGAMLWLGGWEKLLVWIVTVRITNAVSWWSFTWGLHHERYWGSLDGIPFGPRLEKVLRLIFGDSSFNTVRYHFLHHVYPTVPARNLQKLSLILKDGFLKG
jgi:fatty acid desaturase